MKLKKVKALSRPAKPTKTPRHVLKQTKADKLNVKFKPPAAVDRSLSAQRANYPKPGVADIQVRATAQQDADIALLMLVCDAAGWKDYIIVHGHYTVFARKTA
jgi:hypothetical protein